MKTKILIRSKKELKNQGSVNYTPLRSCYHRYVTIEDFISSRGHQYSTATDKRGNLYIINTIQKCINGCCCIESDSDNGQNKYWKKAN